MHNIIHMHNMHWIQTTARKVDGNMVAANSSVLKMAFTLVVKYNLG